RELLSVDGGATVTDVRSTKANVAGAGGNPRFAGGQPGPGRGAPGRRAAGGSPASGAERERPPPATGDLFAGAMWFLTPTAQTDPERYRLVHGFVSALGAMPVAIDPEAPDPLLPASRPRD